MKKQLLFGSALFLATGIFAQAPVRPTSVDQISRYKYGKGMVNETIPADALTSKPVVQQQAAQAKKSASSAWQPLTNSMNVFGVLLSEQRQVTYNEDLDAYCVVGRRGPGYISNPTYTADARAFSGGIVAFVSTDQGNTWDSTLVWNNETHWARYPQGGMWNPGGPPKNTNIANAYVVVTGPNTNAAEIWEGNYFASKKLDVMDSTADGTPGAQRFVEGAVGPYDPNFEKVGMARQGFQATDDGSVHVVGAIVNDMMGTTGATYLFRGLRVLTGSHNSGVFTWSTDSIPFLTTDMPSTVTPGGQTLFHQAFAGTYNMAWSEDGTVGYAWILGTRLNTTDNNVGVQPIVWKTVNGGDWTLMNGINFNDTVKFEPLLKTIKHAWDTLSDNNVTLVSGRRIPSFVLSSNEDIGATVDKNGNLHLTTVVGSTMWNARRYAIATHEYTNALGDFQIYQHAYLGDTIPLIVDYHTNSAGGWDYTIIDTLMSEAPTTSGTDATGYGFQYNPWAAEDNAKQPSAARFQMSRTHDGQYLVYAWADTDPLNAGEFRRWNVKPDIYVRMRHVDSAKVHPMKVNLTGSAASPEVWASAYMFHLADKVKLEGTPTAYDVTLRIAAKATVGKSSPNGMLPSDPVTHYITTSPVSFTLVNTTSIGEHEGVRSSVLFPNPAKGSATLLLDLKNNVNVDINVMNVMGQQVKAQTVKAVGGRNKIAIDLNGLTQGVYLINVSAGEASAVKKIVVE